MPDWTYQTLFRPLLFKIPDRLARECTLQAMGLLSRMPGGAFVIRTLGHMETFPILESRRTGITFKTPVGLSGSLDPKGTAHRAMSLFGFGFVEIGPVTVQPVISTDSIAKNAASEWIRYPSYHENEGMDRIADRLARPGHQLPQFVRLCPMPGPARNWRRKKRS